MSVNVAGDDYTTPFWGRCGHSNSGNSGAVPLTAVAPTSPRGDAMRGSRHPPRSQGLPPHPCSPRCQAPAATNEILRSRADFHRHVSTLITCTYRCGAALFDTVVSPLKHTMAKSKLQYRYLSRKRYRTHCAPPTHPPTPFMAPRYVPQNDLRSSGDGYLSRFSSCGCGVA